MKFTNELGNKIKLKVKKVKSNGVIHKTKQSCKYDGVSIYLEGPTSAVENVITYQEAQMIYDKLGEFLKKYGDHSNVHLK